MSGISSPFHSPVEESVHNPMGPGGGLRLPSGWLLQLKAPNGTGANEGKYVVTVGNATLFASLGSAWYTDVNTPIPLTGAEILALASCNKYHILFSAAKGLVIYNPLTATQSTIDKARKYYKVGIYADDVPTAFFNGVDTTGMTSFAGGPNTFLDYLGQLRTPGTANIMARRGMRFDSGVFYDTQADGTTPIVSSASQKTRTSGTVLDGSELGPDLITVADDRDFSSDTGFWAKGPGATISGGKLVFTGVTPGVGIGRANVFTNGKRYRLEYTIESITGNVYFNVGDVVGIVRNSPGTYVEYLTASSVVSARVWAAVGSTSAVIDNLSIKEVLPAFNGVFTGETSFKRYSTVDPTVMPGFLCEPARTNKCTCVKANPTATTGLTASGSGTAGGVSLVSNSILILNSKLDKLCTSGNLYKLSNSSGGSSATCTISGITGNTNKHSGQCYVSGGSGAIRIGASAGIVTFTAQSILTNIKTENVTPANSTDTLVIVADAGQDIYFIIPDLQEGAFCTPPICTTDTAASETRAATVLTYPTAGKIRSNNMAFRMIVVPRASGQGSCRLFNMFYDANNAFSIYIEPSQIIITNKVSGNSIYVGLTSSYSHSKDEPIEILAVKTSIGMAINARKYSTSSWQTWMPGALATDAVSKANILVPSTYQLGSYTGISQFTGNISLFDTLIIPEGITDPLAYAKAKWGLPA